jgi:phage protein D
VAGNYFYRVGVTASGASYDLSDDISSLTIEQKERQADALTVDVADPFKVLGHALQEGMDVEVELGTDDDHAIIFRGRIYKVDGTFPDTQTPTLKVSAYDTRMKMGLKKRNRPFDAGMTVSQIVKKIAADYTFGNVDVQVLGDPPFPRNGLRQPEKTDLDFLHDLATAYGCVLYVTHEDTSDTFHFISQEAAMTMTPAVKVFYGRCEVDNRLLSFQSSVEAAKIELPRVLAGIDPVTGKPIERDPTTVQDVAKTDDSFFDENLTAFTSKFPDKGAALAGLLTAAPASQAALRADLGTTVRAASPSLISEQQQTAVSQGQFSTSVRGMRANGSTVGIRQITAQTNIDIEDVGGRFSGTWFLSGVRHILDGQGYRTEFECRR